MTSQIARGNLLLFPISSKGSFICTIPQTWFVTQVMEYWLERIIPQWIHDEASIRRPIAQWDILPGRYISLLNNLPIKQKTTTTKQNKKPTKTTTQQTHHLSSRYYPPIDPSIHPSHPHPHQPPHTKQNKKPTKTTTQQTLHLSSRYYLSIHPSIHPHTHTHPHTNLWYSKYSNCVRTNRYHSLVLSG